MLTTVLLAGGVFVLVFCTLWWLAENYRNKYIASLFWQWDNGGDGVQTPRVKIDTDDLTFPQHFLWGVATSAHQSEGGCTSCQWSQWENSVDENGMPRVKDGARSPAAGDGHWHHVHQDISLMKTLGVNAYRFSIEWSKIQPRQGVFDQDAIAHYHAEIDALLANGIQPMITIHHFAHPQWFEEMGSFEHTENLIHLYTYAARIFTEYSSKVKYWCTINEPFFYTFGGWMNGYFPPGKTDQNLTGIVLKNLLEAHVELYYRLKSLPNGMNVEIGLVIAVYHFDAFNPLNPGDRSVASALDSMFNQSTINFLKTGVLVYRHPASPQTIKHYNPKAPKSNDFIGLNYYSHSFVEFNFSLFKPVQIVVPPTALMSDSVNASLYPEGLYRAIVQVSSSLDVPIMITENGCSDANDDKRALFIRRHLYAISQAIRDGYRVRGYFYWSLLDNFEWHEGYTQKYGLYEILSRGSNNERAVRLRDGSKAYMRVIYRFTGRGQYPIFAINNLVEGSTRPISTLRKSSSMGRMSNIGDQTIHNKQAQELEEQQEEVEEKEKVEENSEGDNKENDGGSRRKSPTHSHINGPNSWNSSSLYGNGTDESPGQVVAVEPKKTK